MKNRTLVAPLAVAAIAGLTLTTSEWSVAAPPPRPVVDATLDQTVYQPGDVQTLQLTENVTGRRTFAVNDSNGTVWVRTANTSTSATFTAEAPTSDGTVTVTMTRASDGARSTDQVAYQVQRVSRWPGQVPGKLILGMSCPAPCSAREQELGQPYGVRRSFETWGGWSSIAADADTDHAAGRLPWVSIKGPGGNAAGWRALAAGQYDAAIRSLATTLKAHDDQPIILTFHHEPSNDATEAEGRDWAAAFSRLHDVLAAEGALDNVAFVPIVGEWLFNTANRNQDPTNWVTDDVLSRSSFLGLDLYENNSGETFAERLPRVLTYLDAHGYPTMQVGIGEFGGTDARYDKTTAVQVIDRSLTWAVANLDRIGIASYFNSGANSREGVYWPLNESPQKLATFRGWLDHPAVV